MPPPTFETIQIKLDDQGVALVLFNRPKQANALSPQGYKDWRDAIKWAATESSVKILMMSGNGRFYCAGQELSPPKEEPKSALLARLNTTKDLIDQLIKFPKLSIAVVNGPAVGIGVSTLPLFDVVYSVPNATFNMPFMRFAFCCEGCSSYLYPKILGSSKANSLLLMGETMNATQLHNAGLISELMDGGIVSKALEKAHAAAKFDVNAVMASKELIRVNERDMLLAINKREMEVLVQQMNSTASKDAIRAFIKEQAEKKAKKSKI